VIVVSDASPVRYLVVMRSEEVIEGLRQRLSRADALSSEE
jgi:hypothetical protein